MTKKMWIFTDNMGTCPRRWKNRRRRRWLITGDPGSKFHAQRDGKRPAAIALNP
jgi:hypothetical protein